MSIHIGSLIKEHLESNGQSVTWFAKKINRSRSTCYDIFKSDNIDTILLRKICEILNYDFFKDLSDEIVQKLSKK